MGYSAKGGIAQIKAHPFFFGVNFDTLYSTPLDFSSNNSDVNYVAISPIQYIPDYLGKEPAKVSFTENRMIVKGGIVKKKCGWVYRDRKLILTADNRLYYYDMDNQLKV